MTDAKRAEHVARDNILKLLSNEEIAKISTAEAASGLTEGGEYLDLEHLDQGVQRAKAAIKVAMGQVLPRSAVCDETWSKILAHVVAGDTKSQVEGIINQAAGAAQDLYGQAKETASDAAQAIRHGAVDAEDYVRHTIEKRPYTTALVALCIGILIGRMGRRDW